MTKNSDATTSRVIRRKREKRDRPASARAPTTAVEHVLGDGLAPLGSETQRQPQHPEDRVRDERLEHELRENAGDNVMHLHRANLTGIENEEDGVPADAEDLDDAAEQELADQRVRDQDLDD